MWELSIKNGEWGISLVGKLLELPFKKLKELEIYHKLLIGNSCEHL